MGDAADIRTRAIYPAASSISNPFNTSSYLQRHGPKSESATIGVYG